jgi:hypothetical protein
MQRHNAITSDLCPSNLKNVEAKYGFQPLTINNFLITVTIGDGESCGLSGRAGGHTAYRTPSPRVIIILPHRFGGLGP